MRRRLLIAGIVGLMALGSLALWLAIPLAWLWVTRELEPSGVRFVITIAGCVTTMASGAWFLHRLQATYARVSGAPIPEHEPPSWMRSERERGAVRRQLTLLDRLMVASALVAIVTLVIWWAFFADSPNPSGPLQPL